MRMLLSMSLLLPAACHLASAGEAPPSGAAQLPTLTLPIRVACPGLAQSAAVAPKVAAELAAGVRSEQTPFLTLDGQAAAEPTLPAGQACAWLQLLQRPGGGVHCTAALLAPRGQARWVGTAEVGNLAAVTGELLLDLTGAARKPWEDLLGELRTALLDYYWWTTGAEHLAKQSAGALEVAVEPLGDESTLRFKVTAAKPGRLYLAAEVAGAEWIVADGQPVNAGEVLFHLTVLPPAAPLSARVVGVLTPKAWAELPPLNVVAPARGADVLQRAAKAGKETVACAPTATLSSPGRSQSVALTVGRLAAGGALAQAAPFQRALFAAELATYPALSDEERARWRAEADRTLKDKSLTPPERVYLLCGLGAAAAAKALLTKLPPPKDPQALSLLRQAVVLCAKRELPLTALQPLVARTTGPEILAGALVDVVEWLCRRGELDAATALTAGIADPLRAADAWLLIARHTADVGQVTKAAELRARLREQWVESLSAPKDRVPRAAQLAALAGTEEEAGAVIDELVLSTMKTVPALLDRVELLCRAARSEGLQPKAADRLLAAARDELARAGAPVAERAYAARALGEAFVALGKRAGAEAVLTQLGQWPAPGSREPAVADASAWVVLSLLESNLAAGELGDALKLLPRLKALQPDRFETGCRSVLLAAAEAGDAATVTGVRAQVGAGADALAPAAAVEVALLLSQGKVAEAAAAIRGVTDRELSLALWTHLVRHVTAQAGGEAAVVAATAEALAALPANPPPRADDTPFGFNAADTTPLLAALMEARQYGRAIDVASLCDRPTDVGEALLTALRLAISERNWHW